MSSSSSNGELRIASLLPSITDILLALELQDHIVGVTHECDNFDEYFTTDKSNKTLRHVPILTKSHIDPGTTSQEDIDNAVKKSLYDGLSLYNLNYEEFEACRPSLILTQTLCDVCAVSRTIVDEAVCGLNTGDILSLEPTGLEDVADTFTRVAEACSVPERGVEVRDEFISGLESLQKTVEGWRAGRSVEKPKVLMMEWVEPPFDGGHWVPDMIAYAGCEPAWPKRADTRAKSKQHSWEELYAMDPDVILVACCGFDLQRNVQDALAAHEKFKLFRAYEQGRIYAANGNQYFARPGPKLLSGAAIVARCAYDNCPDLMASIESLPFMPRLGWANLDFSSDPSAQDVKVMPSPASSTNNHLAIHQSA